jgi:hypothetical protein
MGNYLIEAQNRARMPELVKSFAPTAQWEQDGKHMNEIVDKGKYFMHSLGKHLT